MLHIVKIRFRSHLSFTNGVICMSVKRQERDS